MESSIAKKLWHIFHIVYYTLRKGFVPKRKLMMDLHLLLKSGKIASKSLGNLLTFNHHHRRRRLRRDDVSIIIGGFSCRSVDPTLSFYDPREVEFSCSNTPSYPSSFLTKHRRHHRHHDNSTAAAIAKAFEMLNDDDEDDDDDDDDDDDVIVESPASTGTPKWWGLRKSPSAVRVSDSPFPIKEDEAAVGDCEVDRAADEFIRRFYDQLRLQKITS